MKRKLVSRNESYQEEVTNGQFLHANGSKNNSRSFRPRSRNYDQDASIVFFGHRATGTSSLAVIAASILEWKAIDCDRCFEEVTGTTKQQYRRTHSVEQYRRRKLEIVRELLESNPKGCVFACGTVIARQETDFFTTYAKHHPVVYVIREQDLVQRYLGLADNGGWKDTLKYVHSFFRNYSNFEIFNLDEAQEPSWHTTWTRFLEDRSLDIKQPIHPRILRNTRALVSLLLRNIPSSAPRANYSSIFQLFSRSNPELRQGSHVLCIDLADMESLVDSIHSVDTGHDAVQLNISTQPHEWQSLLSGDTLPWAISAIRRLLEVPVIVNIRCIDELLEAGVQTYCSLLHFILRLAPEYIAVDLRLEDEVIKEIVQAKGCTKIIGFFHGNQQLGFWNLKSLIPAYSRAHDLGCDLVKFSSGCQTFHDNIACQQVSQAIIQLKLPTPVITFNIGSLGRLSQVLNNYMTPVIAGHRYKVVESDLDVGFELTTSFQLRTAWYMLLPDSRRKYYVFGAEVRQSLSPAMHNAGFSFCGLPYTYEALESADLGIVEKASSERSFGGASISLPFKSEILALAAKHSPAVKLIGAANTLLPDRKFFESQNGIQTMQKDNNGKPLLVAENTDWIGIYICIAKYCTPANHITKGTSALVIGAGGIARAAIYALVRLGVGNIFILNRTIANALMVKEHFESIDSDLESLHGQSNPFVPRFHVLESSTESWPDGFNLPSIVVGAIPARAGEGTIEYPPELRDDWFGNSTGGLIADLSWKRRATTFGRQLGEAKPRGWVSIDPIEILYEQGCAQFELFTNRRPPRNAMLDAFLDQYNATYKA
ncbi:type I 3-dehydroquinase-domain-containing protein [Xylogone sp. PMI_703]|nr:type I 3-dehydroquinase-domain-containing protein [Xylogone sp. PMI_703]